MGVPGFAQGRSPHALAAASRATTVPRFLLLLAAVGPFCPWFLSQEPCVCFLFCVGFFIYLFWTVRCLEPILSSVQGAGSVCAEARGEVVQG